jgi:hypothetical protein
LAIDKKRKRKTFLFAFGLACEIDDMWRLNLLKRPCFFYHYPLLQSIKELKFTCIPAIVSVADLHHFDADLNPTFHSVSDPDLTLQFEPDPDPTTHFFSILGPSNAPK